VQFDLLFSGTHHVVYLLSGLQVVASCCHCALFEYLFIETGCFNLAQLVGCEEEGSAHVTFIPWTHAHMCWTEIHHVGGRDTVIVMLSPTPGMIKRCVRQTEPPACLSRCHQAWLYSGIFYFRFLPCGSGVCLWVRFHSDIHLCTASAGVQRAWLHFHSQDCSHDWPPPSLSASDLLSSFIHWRKTCS
jgi:hypothetical protein